MGPPTFKERVPHHHSPTSENGRKEVWQPLLRDWSICNAVSKIWPPPLSYPPVGSSPCVDPQRRLRATSYTRLKAHDHYRLRALIGRKGEDRPSSLHTQRWRPKGPKKTSWMESLHGVLHGGLWIKGSWSPRVFVRPTSKRWAWHKVWETVISLRNIFPTREIAVPILWEILGQIPR